LLSKNGNILFFTGTCNETLNTTFICSCADGWKGIHCEIQINYCHNATCVNNGICRPLFLNYTCECLGESYSARHCEITASTTIFCQTLSKSFACVAIIAIIAVAMFVTVLDGLKYFFGIDPVSDELKRLEQIKQSRNNKPPVIVRFIYVNAPSTESVSTVKDSSV
jgi:hypothetical protein